MKFVICHTITIALHTLGSKGEIVIENTESGFNVFGDLFSIQRIQSITCNWGSTDAFALEFLWFLTREQEKLKTKSKSAEELK